MIINDIGAGHKRRGPAAGTNAMTMDHAGPGIQVNNMEAIRRRESAR
jgi:hypothetical protein